MEQDNSKLEWAKRVNSIYEKKKAKILRLKNLKIREAANFIKALIEISARYGDNVICPTNSLDLRKSNHWTTKWRWNEEMQKSVIELLALEYVILRPHESSPLLTFEFILPSD